MSFLKNRGITLIASVLLVVFVSLAVLGVTTFIVQRLLEFNAKRISSSCIYLAQAGMNQALYDFRFHDLTANGYYSLGQTNISTDEYFVIGGTAADLLMVNTSQAALSSNNRQLLNLTIQNVTNSKTLRIDRMVVTWNNSRRLTRIVINGSLLWSGSARSPVDADINPNFTLNTTPTIYPINELRFGASVAGTTISIQFILSDGSTKTVTVYPASNNYNCTVKATGKVTGSNAYRTIEAVYNVRTSRIIQYDEINTPMTP
jgi:hypothetical protein